MNKTEKYDLFYKTPAKAVDDGAKYMLEKRGWESYSLPLGNGHFGANVFGRLETERIQITELSLSNPYMRTKEQIFTHGNAGVDNFAELFVDVNHSTAKNYQRRLNLNTGVSTVKYNYDGVNYKRTYFVSNKDDVLVCNFTADKQGKVSLGIRIDIPFVRDFMVEKGDRGGKSGNVISADDTITIFGEMEYFHVKYIGLLKVVADGGKMTTSRFGRIWVDDANSVTLIFSCGTNYKLQSSVFTQQNPEKKIDGNILPEKKVTKTVEKAFKMGYAKLLSRHKKDFRSMFDRVEFSIGEKSNLPTDQLVSRYKQGERSLYLERLLFHYGRYLLISSSRGYLPASLQGIWNPYCNSPWSVGFWHNINVQMNYWMSCPANLAETFVPYVNYAKAYMERAKEHADEYIAFNYPENLSPKGQNGWLIGTSANAYNIEGVKQIYHSGPGTVAFTSLLFWDYFDYTQDVEFLRDFGYPALRGVSLFFSKILKNIDGKMLVPISASPEQEHDGKYYHTVGCAFDQQLIYENDMRVLQSAKILGIEDDEVLQQIKGRIDKLDPVLIGESGQIKEFREETTYGSIGEYAHRHLSQLVGLYPGTLINSQTPKWMEAAKISLNERGDLSTGWATMHRLLSWARLKDGARAEKIIKTFFAHNVMDNLWDSHPPFQIDGNFGYVAAVIECVLQSHAGFVELLPSVPTQWAKKGAFSGFVARNAFEVSASWSLGKIEYLKVKSLAGKQLKIKLLSGIEGEKRPDKVEGEVSIFNLKKGESIVFTQK